MAKLSVAFGVVILALFVAVVVRYMVNGDSTVVVAFIPLMLLVGGFFVGGRALDELLDLRRERDRREKRKKR